MMGQWSVKSTTQNGERVCYLADGKGREIILPRYMSPDDCEDLTWQLVDGQRFRGKITPEFLERVIEALQKEHDRMLDVDQYMAGIYYSLLMVLKPAYDAIKN